MPVPAAINAVIGIADAPSLDVTAEFKTDGAGAAMGDAVADGAAQAAHASAAGPERFFDAGDARAAGTGRARRAAAPGGVARRDAAPAGDGGALPDQPLRRRAAIAAPARTRSATEDKSHAAPSARRNRSVARSIRAIVRLEPGTHEEARPWTRRLRTPRPRPPATKTPRPPRRIVTYTILGGAVLTLIAVLGIQRQSRAVGTHAPRPGRPSRRCRARPSRPIRWRRPPSRWRGRASSWCSRSTPPARCRG